MAGIAVTIGAVVRGSGGVLTTAEMAGSFWSIAFPLPFEKNDPILCRSELFTRVEPEPDTFREGEGEGAGDEGPGESGAFSVAWAKGEAG